MTPFTENSNCTDPSQPLNAWGIGFVQQYLNASIGADPGVIALGLAEAWLCGSPEKVRLALGWKARSSERNGTALVARYGFAGPEQWQQLDTSQNANPADTMWVLRLPVCLDAGCSQNVLVFVTTGLAAGSIPWPSTSGSRRRPSTSCGPRPAPRRRCSSAISPADGLTINGGAVTITATATDDIGVTRVEILEDGVVAHTLLPGQTTFKVGFYNIQSGSPVPSARRQEGERRGRRAPERAPASERTRTARGP